MAGMTRRDFVSMAHNYADGFARTETEYEASAILWDNVLGFTGIAAASNSNFRIDLFLGEIAARLASVYGGRGLARFNAFCHVRFGRTYY